MLRKQKVLIVHQKSAGSSAGANIIYNAFGSIVLDDLEAYLCVG